MYDDIGEWFYSVSPLLVHKGLVKPQKTEPDLQQASKFSFSAQQHSDTDVSPPKGQNTQAETEHCCVCGPVWWQVHRPEHFSVKTTALQAHGSA